MFKPKISFDNIFINNTRSKSVHISKSKDLAEEPKLEFRLKTVNDNGTGMTYTSKKELIEKISQYIDKCIIDGKTIFDIDISSDADCLYPKTITEFVTFKESKLPFIVTYDSISSSIDAIKNIDDVMSINLNNIILPHLKLHLIKRDGNPIDIPTDFKYIEATYFPSHFNRDHLGYVVIDCNCTELRFRDNHRDAFGCYVYKDKIDFNCCI